MIIILCSNSGRRQSRTGGSTGTSGETSNTTQALETLKQEIWKTRYDIRNNESAMQVVRRNLDIAHRFSQGRETDRIKNDKRTLNELMKLQQTLNRRLSNQTRKFNRLSSESE